MAQLSVATELGQFGPESRAERPLSTEAAVEYCGRFTRRHYENFTVASRLLPSHLLPHFYAVYAYCRWADDLADETGDPQRSLHLLDWWQEELERCYAGEAEHPVFIALRATIREFEIPREPFLICSLRFARTSRSRGMPRMPRCSTIAGARPIPSADWCSSWDVATMTSAESCRTRSAPGCN